jgi:formate hydrogenlyase subunit 3/multisubunit Na+/H+ antiporter MnhD subunit
MPFHDSGGLLPLWQGPLLPLIALAWPLLIGALAALPPLRARAVRLLPLAPLPALILALLASEATVTTVPDLLLGVQLMTDANGTALLGMTAALWLAAGVYAAAYMNAPRKPAIFSGFWCLTLSGNLGVFLAADAVTFYVAFAAVSLAAYFLVVHEGTQGALRASRVYIAMAIVGEALLLIGFVLIMAEAESTAIADMRRALGGDIAPSLRTTAIGLLIAGFGIKAGLVPLHVWLPLAHPAAPTPASAVLSGAIVKAGLIGLMRFLPETDALIGHLLLALGLAGAFLAALPGVTQTRIKAVLAYSTISQMGLLIAAIGAGLAAGGARALQSVTFYAVHHGFAKGALFLLVGLLPLARGRMRWLVLAFAGVLAASIAGLPGTGGALAKAALKPVFDDSLKWLASATGVATSLILLRFVLLAKRVPAGTGVARIPLGMSLPVLATGLTALVLPWLLRTGFDGRVLADLFAASALWSGTWPVLVGVVSGAIVGPIVARRWPGHPRLPEGDLVVVIERLAKSAVAAAGRLAAIEPKRAPRINASPAVRAAAVLETVLQRWPITAAVMIGLLLLVSIRAWH